MCVAIIKPAGQPLPSDEVLIKCWNRNQDGGGYCYLDEGKVHIKKGFMQSPKKMIKSLKSLDKKSLDGPMFIHFRVKSHGPVCPELTHPFPVVKEYNVQRRQNVVCESALMHNGTFSIDVSKLKEVSDTMAFVSEILCKYPDMIKDDDLACKLIVGDCRVAVLNSDGSIDKVGDWKEHEGSLFSNTCFNWGAVSSKVDDCENCKWGRQKNYSYCRNCFLNEDNWDGNVCFVKGEVLRNNHVEACCSNCEHTHKAANQFPCGGCIGEDYKNWAPRKLAVNDTSLVTSKDTGRSVPYQKDWWEGPAVCSNCLHRNLTSNQEPCKACLDGVKPHDKFVHKDVDIKSKACLVDAVGDVITCFDCKHSDCSAGIDPCKSCNEMMNHYEAKELNTKDGNPIPHEGSNVMPDQCIGCSLRQQNRTSESICTLCAEKSYMYAQFEMEMGIEMEMGMGY